MPRASAASRETAAINVKATRIKPPATLPKPAREVWVAIVNSLPGDRFHVSDAPLLSLYAQALVQAEHAMGELAKSGEAGAISPWLKVADTHTKLAATLATKLRLCPQARLDRKTAGPAARDDEGSPKPWER